MIFRISTASLRAFALCVSLLMAAPAFALYSEAPALAAAVKAGTLPPVKERLPDVPEIITPLHSVGSYGGALRSALRSNGDHNAILRMAGNQGLVRWNMDMTKIVPNVAESWTTNADSSEYVFKLRRGMKWSDGQPFNADDILFYVQDLMLNKSFIAAPPGQFSLLDKPMSVDKIDDYTVRFRFVAPYVPFLTNLAHPIGQQPVLYAKHYCSQFHPKYNPKVDELVKSAGVKDWAALMRLKCGDIEIPSRWGNPERPTLDPWIIAEPYSGAATHVVLKRNPYFWQVDSKGQQLPYIDELNFSVISEVETIVLAAISGQLDLQIRHIGITQNLPVLSASATRAGYKVLQLEDTSANAAGLYLNQTTKNDALRALIRNRDFRIALSLAVDRKEIADTVYLGQVEPWQLGPKKGSPFYNEQLAKQFIRHDVATANAMLDRLGLGKRDADGFRLYPQGGRVSISCIVAASASDYVDTLSLVRKQWAKVGVEVVIRTLERSIFFDRSASNDYDMAISSIGGGLDTRTDKSAVLAWSPTESRQSLPWVKWSESEGRLGEEPSDSMKKRLALHKRWRVARTQAEADALLRQILQLAADEFEVIGTVSAPRVPGIVSRRLANVHDKMPWTWAYATPAGSLPQQYYFRH